MGMYDIITDVNKYIGVCPVCNKVFNRQQEWQTKSGQRLLFNYKFNDFRNKYENFEVHTICDKCNNYISFRITKNDIKYIDTKEE